MQLSESPYVEWYAPKTVRTFVRFIVRDTQPSPARIEDGTLSSAFARRRYVTSATGIFPPVAPAVNFEEAERAHARALQRALSRTSTALAYARTCVDYGDASSPRRLRLTFDGSRLELWQSSDCGGPPSACSWRVGTPGQTLNALLAELRAHANRDVTKWIPGRVIALRVRRERRR